MSAKKKLPEAALEFFRKKGQIGGRRRAANLSAEERSEQAQIHARYSPCRRAQLLGKLARRSEQGHVRESGPGHVPRTCPFWIPQQQGDTWYRRTPRNAPIAKRVFELYVGARHSLSSLSKELKKETGVRLSKANLHQMLTNPFYVGQFIWRGQTYHGTHTPLISPEMYERTQDVLHGHNKPKYSKHTIAFRGLLTCAHDNCLVTAEFKKGKYVYYRCSGGRGPCALPRFREQEIAGQLANVVRDVVIPPEVAQRIVKAMERDHVEVGVRVAQERARLSRELSTLRARMDAAYCDKLDGKISAEFWQRKQVERQAEELRITSRLSGLKEPAVENSLADVRRVLELAQRAYSLYITQKPVEQAELLRELYF